MGLKKSLSIGLERFGLNKSLCNGLEKSLGISHISREKVRVLQSITAEASTSFGILIKLKLTFFGKRQNVHTGCFFLLVRPKNDYISVKKSLST